MVALFTHWPSFSVFITSRSVTFHPLHCACQTPCRSTFKAKGSSRYKKMLLPEEHALLMQKLDDQWFMFCYKVTGSNLLSAPIWTIPLTRLCYKISLLHTRGGIVYKDQCLLFLLFIFPWLVLTIQLFSIYFDCFVPQKAVMLKFSSILHVKYFGHKIVTWHLWRKKRCILALIFLSVFNLPCLSVLLTRCFTEVKLDHVKRNSLHLFMSANSCSDRRRIRSNYLTILAGVSLTERIS